MTVSEKGSVIRIRLQSFDAALLEVAVRDFLRMVDSTGAILRGPIPLPTKRKQFTLLRSPLGHKDARDQYCVLTHKRLLMIVSPTNKTMDALMRIDLASGVDVQIEVN
jgi:small subunit ribosomal protein S10